MTILDLCIDRRRCTGEIPPPLVGATTTIVRRQLFVIGGRSLQSKRSSCEVYCLDLDTAFWTHVDTSCTDTTRPKARYFHTASAYGEKIVIFGGMQGDRIESAEAAAVLDDISIFDTISCTWTTIKRPSLQTSLWAQPRYAHLSTTSADKLIVVGGQDLANDYLQDIAIFDLHDLVWTSITPADLNCGSYRAFLTSSNAPLNVIYPDSAEAERAEAEVAEMHTTISPFGHKRELSQSPIDIDGVRRSEDPPTPGAEPDRTGSSTSNPLYLYCNQNFADVQRRLLVSPAPDASGSGDGGNMQTTSLQFTDFSAKMQASEDGLPPGLRFPTGSVFANHLILTGTYLTNTTQTMAIWAMALETHTWKRIELEPVLGQASWNRAIMCDEMERLVLLGDMDRQLADDYNLRRVNFEHLCLVDLEAFEIIQPEHDEMSPLSKLLGKSMLSDINFADMELLTQDRVVLPINSNVLLARCPGFMQLIHGNVPFPTSSYGQFAANIPGGHLAAASMASAAATSISAGIAPVHRHGSIGSSSLMSRSFSQQPRTSIHESSLHVPTSWRKANDRTALAIKLAGPRSIYVPFPSIVVNALIHWLYTGSLPRNVFESVRACCHALMMVNSFLLWSVDQGSPQPGARLPSAQKLSKTHTGSSGANVPHSPHREPSVGNIATLPFSVTGVSQPSHTLAAEETAVQSSTGLKHQPTANPSRSVHPPPLSAHATPELSLSPEMTRRQSLQTSAGHAAFVNNISNLHISGPQSSSPSARRGANLGLNAQVPASDTPLSPAVLQPPALVALARTLRKRLHVLLNADTANTIYETCVLLPSVYIPTHDQTTTQPFGASLSSGPRGDAGPQLATSGSPLRNVFSASRQSQSSTVGANPSTSSAAARNTAHLPPQEQGLFAGLRQQGSTQGLGIVAGTPPATQSVHVIGSLHTTPGSGQSESSPASSPLRASFFSAGTASATTAAAMTGTSALAMPTFATMKPIGRVAGGLQIRALRQMILAADAAAAQAATSSTDESNKIAADLAGLSPQQQHRGPIKRSAGVPQGVDIASPPPSAGALHAASSVNHEASGDCHHAGTSERNDDSETGMPLLGTSDGFAFLPHGLQVPTSSVLALGPDGRPLRLTHSASAPPPPNIITTAASK
ncbi:hypothetical protein PYCC9005_002415 [Savitreella phatthalungensis]